MEFVRERGRLRSDAATGKAIKAVLAVLGERISVGQAEDIAAALPQELRPYVRRTVQAEPFTLSAFLAKVAEQEEVDIATAEEHCRAVLTVLGEWIPRAELRDTLEQLPNEMRGLFTRIEKAA
jgi:uncharacterized protein (DUF2267 family)